MKILHDIHTHNIFSSCCADRTASTLNYIKKEAELGNKLFGLSNHIWDERVKGSSYWYRIQSIAKAEEAKNAFYTVAPGMRVLFGAETEYYACRDLLGMSEEGAEHFDYLLVPHSHLHMRNEVMSEYPEVLEARRLLAEQLKEALPQFNEEQINRMVASMKEADFLRLIPELQTDTHDFLVKAMVDGYCGLMENEVFRRIAKKMPVAVAHPFSPCGVSHSEKNSYLERIDSDTFRDCFQRTAALGAFVEINVGAVKEVNSELSNNEMIRMFRCAKEVGCKFTFGTDSHSVKGLELIRFGDQVADALDLKRSDFAEFVADAVSE